MDYVRLVTTGTAIRYDTIRYDTIAEFNVDSKAEYLA